MQQRGQLRAGRLPIDGARVEGEFHDNWRMSAVSCTVTVRMRLRATWFAKMRSMREAEAFPWLSTA